MSPGVLDRFFEVLGREPSAEAIVEVHGDRLVPTSRGDLAAMVARARGAMRGAGVKPGDRVALLAPNSARWVACDLAGLFEGAVVVPLYARQDPRELAAMLADCTPSLLVVADATLEAAIRGAWVEPCLLRTFDRLFQAEPVDDPPHPRAAADPLTLVYTSGTSGEPKGAVLTRANMDFMVPATAGRLDGLCRHRKDRGEVDRVFHFLPCCFAGSRVVLWTQLYRENPLMLSTDLNDLAREMGAADPHYYLNVPAVLERIRSGVEAKVSERGGIAATLLRRGFSAHLRRARGEARPLDRLLLALARRLVFSKIKARIGPRLELLICGSAPLSERTQRWFEMIGVPVYQVYGLTETTAIVTMDLEGRIEPGRVGHPVEGVEVRRTEEGELVTRGPHVFAGYWGRPEATAEALRGGWFHSGDQVEIQENGNLRIVGRLKNLLVPESGHNVPPEPLEQKVREACPGIDQVMVVGHGRPYLTILVCGGVADADLRAALDRVNADLPHYKRLRRFLRCSEPFTVENGLLTANQKMRRSAIEARFAADIDRVYAS